jgi:nucleotidyltransferase AbiEii toxin of type IV toxin-antitoxin system
MGWSVKGLVCMKLSAIASRGKARDFWDLHELLGESGTSLAEALVWYRQKYSAEDIGHVVRSLAYFADAESEPFPRGLTLEHWRTIAHDLEVRVREL